MMLLVIVFLLGSVVAAQAAAAHANAIVANALTISRSPTGAASATDTAGGGAVVCHARGHAVTPRCCNSASEPEPRAARRSRERVVAQLFIAIDTTAASGAIIDLPPLAGDRRARAPARSSGGEL